MNVGRSVQKDLYSALSTDVALTALIGSNKIFDHVPQAQPFPFIKIGEAEYNPSNGVRAKIYRGQLQIDVWTRAADRGRAGNHDVLNEIRRILDGNRSHATIEAAGYCTLVFDETFSTVLEEPDTVTYHGIIRFNVILGGKS